MDIHFSKRLDETEKRLLRDLFLQTFVRQITIPLRWKLFPQWYLKTLRIKVFFIHTDEYAEYNLRMENKPSMQHMAVTFRKKEPVLHGDSLHTEMINYIVFDMSILHKMYQSPSLEYFSLNSYAFVISHELIHLQIITDPSIPDPLRYKYHRFLDQYSAGEHPLNDVYDVFTFRGIRIQHFNYEKFKQYAEKFITLQG